MARLPTAEQLGERPNPQGVRPVAGYTAGRAESAEVAAAQQSVKSASEFVGVGEKLMAAENRIRTQQESVALAKAINQFNEEANAELRRIETEADLTDVSTTNTLGRTLAERQKALVDGFGGSDMGRSRLYERLESVRGSIVGQAAAKATAAQRKVVADTLQSNIGRLTARAAQNPTEMVSLWGALDADIDDMAAALTPEQETQFRALGRQQIALSVLNGYLARDAAKEAKTLLTETPGLMETLSPEQQRSVMAKIGESEQAEMLARTEGQRLVAKAEWIKGGGVTRVPLTLAERLQLAELAPSQPRAPMFQDLPVDGDKIQRVVSYDNGASWAPFGAAYDRREPYIIQQIQQPDGTMQTIAVPRAAIGAPPASGQAPSVAAPTSQPSQSAPPPGSPPGSVVVATEPAKPLTESQANAALFADRGNAANAILTQFEGEGTNPFARVFEKLPGGNYLQSDEYQQFEQAKRDFLNAVLRKESGATIQPSEFESGDKQYFPRPGDSDKVIKQKKKNRETAIEAIARAAGPSYKGAKSNASAAGGSGGDDGKKKPRYRLDLNGNIIGSAEAKESK